MIRCLLEAVWGVGQGSASWQHDLMAVKQSEGEIKSEKKRCCDFS